MKRSPREPFSQLVEVGLSMIQTSLVVNLWSVNFYTDSDTFTVDFVAGTLHSGYLTLLVIRVSFPSLLAWRE